ncbi:hypothetical protein SmJEL517_g00160 [Synchytrium microbalum]|uniref:Kinesin-like protein n=1 Tax=Synchytrium microbalum TaxID=1806994 RepID=A0A507CIX5_9FUNG|nr:uncharacterized protein SmJEL517_g00160 [Synchytrium microbalum]TPX38124.1 hypothetical protein SmJEL517_g00160 [Synchytrium microbalum]
MAAAPSSEKEAVKVVVRVRPFSEKEKNAGHSNIVSIDHKDAVVRVVDPRPGGAAEPPKSFTFDSAFDSNCLQIDVYNITARPIVESVLEGYNGTIFAYGQTGTGKTFSMEGVRDVPELRGIIPNSFEHIFSHIKHAPPGVQYLVRASYLEIYNEDIRDLLNPKGDKLDIKERTDTGVYVKDLSTFVVKDVTEMDKLMSAGNKNRSVGATEMNAHSSRSHSIFTVTVERSEAGQDGDEHIRAGKLHLVDLAGSERQAKTGATGDRLKEATKINLSLSALGNVISSLVDGKSSHIPYRDSKLTRLLQDSLGGNARTLMIATMSPASYNYDETVSTLRYANRAKCIKNKPKINEDPKDAMLREFQDEIKRLKAQLDSLEHGGEDNMGEDGTRDMAQHDDKHGKRKQKTKRKKSSNKEDGQQPHAVNDESRPHLGISESQLADMQDKVAAEKNAIVAAKDMEESEKNRLLEEVTARAEELERERTIRNDLAAKVAQLQEKLLVGGVNILDKHEEQQLLLAKRAQEIEERRRKERELQRALENQKEAALQVEEEYATLKEAAAGTTRKLKQTWNLLMQTKSEIKDLQTEHQRERESLLETIRGLARDLKLESLIVDSYVPPEELALIESHMEYDEQAEKWRIAHAQYTGNQVKSHHQEDDVALRRDHNEESDSTWDPYCIFPDVYLSYEAFGVASPIRKPSRKDASKSVVRRMSAGGLLSGKGKQEKQAPIARGLVQGNKRYA